MLDLQVCNSKIMLHWAKLWMYLINCYCIIQICIFLLTTAETHKMTFFSWILVKAMMQFYCKYCTRLELGNDMKYCTSSELGNDMSFQRILTKFRFVNGFSTFRRITQFYKNMERLMISCLSVMYSTAHVCTFGMMWL